MELKIEDLTKRFDAVTAVDRLSVTIQSGELVCLLGPSGCGKSTTLSMVAGLETPTAGEIFFDRQPMASVAAEVRDIGMVFQNYALYPHMSVAENILFPLKMQRIPKADRRKQMEAAADLLQIRDLLHRKPAQLSGGQQQRVAIARAVVKKPRLLLMDEPFSNLDARLRIELRNDIRALQQQLGITTIFVTHDQEEAMSISDRILLLNHGKLQQYATPEEMYRHPSNRFAAGFLGNPPMNFLPCVRRGDELCLAGAFSLATDRAQGALLPDGVSTAGIRPEDLELAPESACDFVGKITALQPLGKEVYLRLAVGAHTLTACLRWDRPYVQGQLLPLRLRRLQLFPPEGQVEYS